MGSTSFITTLSVHSCTSDIYNSSIIFNECIIAFSRTPNRVHVGADIEYSCFDKEDSEICKNVTQFPSLTLRDCASTLTVAGIPVPS